MIQVFYKAGFSCPMIVCDQCGEPINKARGGIYAWRSALDLGDAPQDVYIVHKGACDRQLTARLGQTRWTNISALPAFLAHNLGLTCAESEREVDEAEDLFRILDGAR